MIIAVDFDGTIVEWAFPEIGADVPLAFETLLEVQRLGHPLILWTVRTNEYLKHAYDYCVEKGLIFWGVNENPTQKFWSSSPKAHADIFIDDAALGCPLTRFPDKRPCVDWGEVQKYLKLKLK